MKGNVGEGKEGSETQPNNLSCSLSSPTNVQKLKPKFLNKSKQQSYQDNMAPTSLLVPSSKPFIALLYRSWSRTGSAHIQRPTFCTWLREKSFWILKMEEILNGSLTEDTSQKSEVVVVMPDDDSLGMRSVVDEERFEVAVGENGMENGKDGDGSISSSSSSDEETEVAAEKIDEMIASMVECGSQENEVVSGLITEEEAAVEIAEGLEVAMVEEEGVKITVEAVEGEREVTVAEDSEAVEVVAVELTDAVEEKAAAAEEPDQVEAVNEVLAAAAEAREVEVAGQEATDGLLKQEEESSPAVTKLANDAEIPESNGNPHIISISTRAVQRTSWRGCCGLLEVFRRGDRG